MRIPTTCARVVRACDAGTHSRDQLAALFGVSTAWIRRLRQRRRPTGSFAALPWNGGPKPTLGAAQRQQLAQLVHEDADATLAELRHRLGTPVSVSTLCRAPQALRLPLKKSVAGRRAAAARRRRAAGGVAPGAAPAAAGAAVVPRRERGPPGPDPAVRPRPARGARLRRRAAGDLADDHDDCCRQ
jgi:transposase